MVRMGIDLEVTDKGFPLGTPQRTQREISRALERGDKQAGMRWSIYRYARPHVEGTTGVTTMATHGLGTPVPGPRIPSHNTLQREYSHESPYPECRESLL
jgi:hypothetical protein